MANLRQNPAIEINVLDMVLRKGYRFEGKAIILSEGPQYEAIYESYKSVGHDRMIDGKEVVLIQVERAEPLISPAYDVGANENDVREDWLQYWNSLHGQVVK